MANLKVQLKNVKTFEGREGIGLNADIYINGVKCIHVFDDANGGCFDYDYFWFGKNVIQNERVKSLVNAMKDHIATLPKRKMEFGGVVHEFDVDMDVYVNDLLEEWEKEKSNKKMLKLQETAILIGVPNASRYSYFNLKRPMSTFPKSVLQTYVNQIVQKHCKDGVQILNTNLQALGVTF